MAYKNPAAGAARERMGTGLTAADLAPDSVGASEIGADAVGASEAGVTAGTVTASKPVVPDSNKDIGSFRNLTATGLVTAGKLKGGSSAPAIAAGAGAGAGASASVSGTDTSGEITVVTAGTPSAEAVVATLTFNSAYSSAPHVVISPANAAAASLGGPDSILIYVTSTTSTFVLNSTGNAPAAALTLKWKYVVVQ